MSERKRFRRWNYVVDWKSQVGTAVQIIAVLAGICLIIAVGVNFVKSDGAIDEMSPVEVRNFLFKTTSIQFLINSGTLALLAIYLTHRFAGPAFVMERAIRETLRGDHGRRIHLRERDYLKPLAQSVEDVRRRVEERETLLVELAGCVDKGDLETAREVLRRASGQVEEKDAPAPETAEVATEAAPTT